LDDFERELESTDGLVQDKLGYILPGVEEDSGDMGV